MVDSVIRINFLNKFLYIIFHVWLRKVMSNAISIRVYAGFLVQNIKKRPSMDANDFLVLLARQGKFSPRITRIPLYES